MAKVAKTLLMLVVASMGVSGCGQRQQMAFPTDRAGPARPVGAPRAPTAGELQTPSAQAQPRRSDELLQRSDEREPDPFDLPPA